jgi:hypothetical protein
VRSPAAILRLANFMALYDHALRGPEMRSFNSKEIGFARQLIEENAGLDIHAYVKHLNRLLIVDPDVRESRRLKLWSCILEAATAEVQKKRYRKEFSNQNLEGKLRR